MKASMGAADLASSILAGAAYEDHQRQLRLEFHDGSRYLYFGVSADLFRQLLCAPSKGSFFNRYIRGHFLYAKLPTKN